MKQTRNLVILFPDQLNTESTALSGFDPKVDRVVMPESLVWRPSVHRKKAALLVAAFRRFRDTLEQKGYRVDYASASSTTDVAFDFYSWLPGRLKEYRPQGLVATVPGEYDLEVALRNTARDAGAQLEIRRDDWFFTSPEEFEEYAEGRKRIVLEYFYRGLRRREGILMEEDNSPTGGFWNFDDKNRESFSKKEGPPPIPDHPRFSRDRYRESATEVVDSRAPANPGSIDLTDQPITPEEATTQLDHFIHHLLPSFGSYQDAMWDAAPSLFHSRLSFALNTRLLHPRTVVSAAERAYHENKAPLPAVEGFIRQVLGWREYVRGVYWKFMPEYRNLNALSADAPVPEFFWTGETQMRCVSSVMADILAHGYAHHIQRLMVVGLYALLSGVNPYAFHEWHLAMYVDAFDWVSLPNALGMSLYADDGIMATKPYCAGGGYINRMSNYCGSCRYNPKASTGPEACPFTLLYWDFLQRHEERLSENRRMQLQLKNLRRKDASELGTIRKEAEALRSKA